jgi:hypothetical protein
MFSSLLQYIKKNFLPLSATIVGVLFLVFSIMNQQWWGERAFGVIIGATVLSAVITSMYFLETLSKLDTVQYLAPSMVVFSALAAFIVRLRTGGGNLRPLQLSVAAPSNQTILLMVFFVAMFILLVAFGRALARGEGVSFESHWGGLGGGISGWKISSAFIYLLGIVFLLLFSSVIAWRIFVQTTQPAPTPNPVTTATQNS